MAEISLYLRYYYWLEVERAWPDRAFQTLEISQCFQA